MRRLLWIFPTAVALVFVLVLLVAGRGDVPYITRVLVHRDSSITDVDWKSSVTVPAVSPRPWAGASGCPALPTTNAQSIVLVKDGRLVCSWGSADRPAAAFSISKTLVSLLASRSLPLDTSLGTVDPRFTGITVGDLLDMRSGIAFSPNTPYPWVNTDQAAVYYASDLASTVLRRATVTSPPGVFTYNDYAPNLVGLTYQRLSGGLLTDGPLRSLWAELGAQDPVSWCVDSAGFPYHESGLVVSARDLARVGQRVLDGGAWASRSLSGSPTVETFGGLDAVGYRNGWWVLPRPDGSGDLAAMGDHGQIMVVSPRTRTVAVRMGDDDGANITIARQLQAVANAL
ncbi:serine hydrolase [Pseudonocardia ailaonensis]|uniref:Serine hydrolase n=1 Tax=Pseudonocardia ailaonensis TaxID=367279 RepID=A0ABN2NHZ3_9PSEU